MIETVVEASRYLIEQYDTSNTLVNSEVHLSSDVDEQFVSDRAAELEATSPELKTIWFKVGEVKESVFLPGTVVEIPIPSDAVIYDVENAEVDRITRNDEELEKYFYLPDMVSGDVINFYDSDNVLVAQQIVP